jgi:hypothetical protein
MCGRGENVVSPRYMLLSGDTVGVVRINVHCTVRENG